MKTSMQTKLLVLLAGVGLSIASAKSFNIDVPSDAVIAGTSIKAGDYSLKVNGAEARFTSTETNKTIDVTGTSETSATKFPQTTVLYSKGEDGKNHVKEIDLGGTTTKLEFNN